jgi:PhnB protein
MKLNPYLIFNGNCAEAFTFYEQCLGGKIATMTKYSETPAAKQMPPDAQDKIIHALLVVDGHDLMGADAPPEHYEKMAGSSVCLNVDKPADAERIFQALAENGSVRMPMAKTFWAARFGMLVDRFGIPWLINCEHEG